LPELIFAKSTKSHPMKKKLTLGNFITQIILMAQIIKWTRGFTGNFTALKLNWSMWF